MTSATSNAPRVGDLVHYVPLATETPGCRAAIVTETHYDPQLASLMVIHSTGVQFLPDIRQAEMDYAWDKYPPGTWHTANHL